MSIFALLSLLASGFGLFLGLIVYYMDSRNALNRIFTLLCISTAFVSFTEFGYRNTIDFNTAYIWLKMSSFWPLVLSFLLHFALIFTEQSKLLRNKLTYYLMYVPALTFSLLDLTTNLLTGKPVKEYWGWTFGIAESSLIFYIASIWQVAIVVLTVFLCLRYFLKTTDNKTKEQAKYITIGLSIPVAVGIITEILVPFLPIRLPELTTLGLVVGCIFIAYAIWKYSLFFLTPGTAAESIISTMSDSLLLLNPDRKIVTVNDATLKLLGYEESELIDQPLENIFTESGEKTIFESTEFKRLKGKDIIKDFEMSFKTKTGRNVPVSLSVSTMRNVYGKVHGFVCIGRDITERKRAQEALCYRVEFEKLITNISTNFINLKPEEIDDGMNQALKTIGEFAGVDRSYIFLLYDNGTKMDNTHEWCAQGIEPQIQNLKGLAAKDVPWWMGKLNRFEVIHIPRVAELPRAAEAEKEILQAQAIQSLIVVPMIYSGSLIGFLGFDSVRTEKTWMEGGIALLKILGEFFANALERKWVDEALKESEKKYRTLVETAQEGIGITDPDENIIFVNQAFADFLGYKKEELLEMNLSQISDKEEFARFKKETRRRKEGKKLKYEIKLYTKTGELKYFNLSANPIFEGKTFIGTLGLLVDINERKQTEEALRESEERFRTIFETAKDSIFIKDRALKYIHVNPAMERIFGLPALELIGLTDKHLFGKESAAHIREMDSRVLGGEIVEEEHTKSVKGVPFTFHIVKVPMRDNFGKIIGLCGIARDITERKRAEEALRESEERYKTLTENVNVGVYRNSPGAQGKFIEANPAIIKMFGYKNKKEFLAIDVADLYQNPEDRKKFNEKMLRNGFVRDEELKLKKKDGTTFIGSVSAVVVKDETGEVKYFDGIIEDITERKKLEQDLLKASKLESIGVLAGGIAHDFNNILTAILGNITLAKMRTKPEDKVYGKLIEAEKASLRAQNLTQQLLSFSKGGVPIRRAISIPKLLKDTANFALSGSNVSCKFLIPDDLWPVDIDEGQINQVINNVIINANQAMPKGGTIEMRAENINIGAKDSLPLRHGKYVRVSIKDHGVGISKEHLLKIFDPYFSTKDTGSGFGLTIVYHIVKNHDGHIAVESKLGVGTTFYIYLPTSSKKEIPLKKKKKGALIFGKGRILVMDDEKAVRDVVGDMLRHIGYSVKFTRDGGKAIKMYKKAKDSNQPFDAVIMDLTIAGGMGGKDTIKKLLKIDPKIKAIVSSGYSDDPILANFRKYGFSGFVAKPFKIEELSKVLHKVIKGK